jgi:glyoxylase-like metal-dependent hydrolase (beta-lactamase superfamily II)
MTANNSVSPTLASVVREGDQQHQAVAINDFIFRVNDISNAYLITSDDGDVLINTGFMDQRHVDRNKALLTPVRTGPLRYIILTQAHPDHYGGVPHLREPDTQVVAGQRFLDTWQYFHDLGPYLTRQTEKLWGSTLQRGENPPPPPRVVPDIEVGDVHTLLVGGRRLELLSTPGGESLDALCVWLPEDGIVFSGNLFGPLFNAMPNLTTIRGDKPRLSTNYLSSLIRIRDLDAELLITGHGEPIAGGERIRTSLQRMHDAVEWLRQAVISGMNAGHSLYQLMQDIRLPEQLALGEGHGKVSWAVRAIWEELSGWFHYEDSTPALYGVAPSALYSEVIDLAGGADAVAARAAANLAQEKPLEAIMLADIALSRTAAHSGALLTKQHALMTLLKQAGDNLSLIMWLKSELTAVEDRLVKAAG